MLNKFKAFVFIVVVLFMAGCASGPKFNDIQSSIPTLKSSEGRIYFYRSGSMFGAALQPMVKLNGKEVGQSKPGGFFFVDTAPGSYEVMTGTEVERNLTLTLEAGQVRYVKTTVGFGIMVGRVYPELVDSTVGQNEIKEASYIGSPIKK